jgi:hypothetical protein
VYRYKSTPENESPGIAFFSPSQHVTASSNFRHSGKTNLTTMPHHQKSKFLSVLIILSQSELMQNFLGVSGPGRRLRMKDTCWSRLDASQPRHFVMTSVSARCLILAALNSLLLIVCGVSWLDLRMASTIVRTPCKEFRPDLQVPLLSTKCHRALCCPRYVLHSSHP